MMISGTPRFRFDHRSTAIHDVGRRGDDGAQLRTARRKEKNADALPNGRDGKLVVSLTTVGLGTRSLTIRLSGLRRRV